MKYSNLESLDKIKYKYMSSSEITIPNKNMIMFCAKFDYVKTAGYCYRPSGEIVSLFNNSFGDKLPTVKLAADNTSVTITFGQTYFSLFIVVSD